MIAEQQIILSQESSQESAYQPQVIRFFPKRRRELSEPQIQKLREAEDKPGFIIRRIADTLRDSRNAQQICKSLLILDHLFWVNKIPMIFSNSLVFLRPVLNLIQRTSNSEIVLQSMIFLGYFSTLQLQDDCVEEIKRKRPVKILLDKMKEYIMRQDILEEFLVVVYNLTISSNEVTRVFIEKGANNFLDSVEKRYGSKLMGKANIRDRLYLARMGLCLTYEQAHRLIVTMIIGLRDNLKQEQMEDRYHNNIIKILVKWVYDNYDWKVERQAIYILELMLAIANVADEKMMKQSGLQLVLIDMFKSMYRYYNELSIQKMELSSNQQGIYPNGKENKELQNVLTFLHFGCYESCTHLILEQKVKAVEYFLLCFTTEMEVQLFLHFQKNIMRSISSTFWKPYLRVFNILHSSNFGKQEQEYVKDEALRFMYAFFSNFETQLTNDTRVMNQEEFSKIHDLLNDDDYAEYMLVFKAQAHNPRKQVAKMAETIVNKYDKLKKSTTWTIRCV